MTSDLTKLTAKQFDSQFERKLVTNLKELEPWIREAYRRIENGEKVLGCKTKEQLCEWRIGRAESTIRNLLNGAETRRNRPLESSGISADSKRLKRISSGEAKARDEYVDNYMRDFHARQAAAPPALAGPSPDVKRFAEEIISAGRRELARVYHPDKGGNAEDMILINSAAGYLNKLLETK